MASRDAILEHARELLDLDSFHDYGPMGLQVVGADEVTKIAASVSSSLEAFSARRTPGRRCSSSTTASTGRTSRGSSTSR